VRSLINSHTKHVYTGQSSVKAAFLVDPVDNTRETPESVDYPSAAKALKSANRPVGIAGASVITGCNPAGSNWEVFTSTCSIMLSLTIHCVIHCVLHTSKHLNQGPGMWWLLIAVCAVLANQCDMVSARTVQMLQQHGAEHISLQLWYRMLSITPAFARLSADWLYTCVLLNRHGCISMVFRCVY